jgi:hypothetical protein
MLFIKTLRQRGYRLSRKSRTGVRLSGLDSRWPRVPGRAGVFNFCTYRDGKTF